MLSLETIETIKNATITIVAKGKELRSVFPNSSFQSLLLARAWDNPAEDSHILIRDTFLDILDEKLRLFNWSQSQVDSFRFSYKDGEGYKHIIER